MQEAGLTLVVAGVVCIVAAIAGGKVDAPGWKIPSLRESRPRELVLGGFGVVSLVLGLVLVSELLAPNDDGGNMDGTPSQTSDSKTERPTPTPSSEDSPTETSSTEPLGDQHSTGVGTVAHCRSVSVRVGEVVQTSGKLHVPLRITNGATNVPIQLPPLDDVHLIDSDGNALPIHEFANLGTTWGIGPKVLPGSTFMSSVIFRDDEPNRAKAGSLEIVDISDADNPFTECSVKVEGIRLP